MKLALPVLFLALFTVSARGQTEKNPEPPAPTPRQVESATPRTSVTETADRVSFPADRPREKMKDALEEISEQELDDAAEEIHEVVKSLQAAADTAEGDSVKADLLRSVRELEAKEKSSNLSANSSAELGPIFSRALAALSIHHVILAAFHWKEDDKILTGFDLHAATLDALDAARYGKVSLTPKEDSLLSRASEAATRLIEQKKVEREAVQALLGEMHAFTATLENRVPRN
ncbi:MAG TPA: hypothetical protein VFP10_11240 [Candidatus Eisenbacteria bacterium]|nr:hypothetical protein [Candidatus Eisenbacteria bacterium]